MAFQPGMLPRCSSQQVGKVVGWGTMGWENPRKRPFPHPHPLLADRFLFFIFSLQFNSLPFAHASSLRGSETDYISPPVCDTPYPTPAPLASALTIPAGLTLPRAGQDRAGDARLLKGSQCHQTLTWCSSSTRSIATTDVVSIREACRSCCGHRPGRKMHLNLSYQSFQSLWHFSMGFEVWCFYKYYYHYYYYYYYYYYYKLSSPSTLFINMISPIRTEVFPFFVFLNL